MEQFWLVGLALCAACADVRGPDAAPPPSWRPSDAPDVRVAPAVEVSLVFRDQTVWARLDHPATGFGLTAIDIDDDGWDDLAVPSAERLRIYRNTRDGSFYEWTAVAHAGTGALAYTLDLSGDGRCDLLY